MDRPGFRIAGYSEQRAHLNNTTLLKDPLGFRSTINQLANCNS